MRTAPRLQVLAILASLLGTQACSGSGGAPGKSDASAPRDGSPAGDAKAPGDASDSGAPGLDSGGSSGPCFLPGAQGSDAATCVVGSDCQPGQVCVVAEGCFCTANGRCFDLACDGGLSSPGCAQSVCTGIGATADADGGTISCFVEGC